MSCRKAVEQLVGEREDQVVLFGGTSAGGRGSMVLVDFLPEVRNLGYIHTYWVLL